jgi:hypothetical protein
LKMELDAAETPLPALRALTMPRDLSRRYVQLPRRSDPGLLTSLGKQTRRNVEFGSARLLVANESVGDCGNVKGLRFGRLHCMDLGTLACTF